MEFRSTQGIELIPLILSSYRRLRRSRHAAFALHSMLGIEARVVVIAALRDYHDMPFPLSLSPSSHRSHCAQPA
jgi:hypothetical protein